MNIEEEHRGVQSVRGGWWVTPTLKTYSMPCHISPPMAHVFEPLRVQSTTCCSEKEWAAPVFRLYAPSMVATALNLC